MRYGLGSLSFIYRRRLWFGGLKHMFAKHSRVFMILGLVLAIALTAYAVDSRTKLKPGWNLFSPQQDIELGRDVSRQAERELSILNDRQANSYISALGRQLAAHA